MIAWPRRVSDALHYRVSANGSTRQLDIKDHRALGVLFEIPSSGIDRALLLSKFVLACELTPESAVLLIDEFLKFEILLPRDPGISPWIRFGWAEPLRFHSATRMPEFLDDSQHRNPIRTREETIESYLATSSAPAFPDSFSAIVALPKPESACIPDIPETLIRRRTVRSFAGEDISLAILSRFLAYSSARMANLRRRTADAPGNTTLMLENSDYSAFNINVIVHRVSGLESGIYRYDPAAHGLSLSQQGDYEEQVVHSVWGQPMARRTCFSLFFSCVFERYQWRYRYPRGYQNLLINLGELVQFCVTAANFLDLGACLTPALRDDFVNRLIGVDGTNEEVLYYVGVGVPRGGRSTSSAY